MNSKIFLLVVILLFGMMFSIGGVWGVPTLTNYAIPDIGIVKGTIIGNATYNQNGYYNFDGVSSIINLDSNIGIFNHSGNITISLFANLTTTSGTQTLASKYSSSGKGWIFRTAGSDLHLLLYNSSGTAQDITVSSVVSTGFHQYSFVVNSSNYANIYVDGILKSSTLITNGFDGGITPLLQIGSRGVDYLNGSIDEIRIYNTSLNTSSINQIYTNGLTPNSNLLNTNLVEYFTFSDAGTIIATGSGILNMTYVNNTIFDRNKISDMGGGTFLLYANLNINSATINLTLNPSDLNELRLYSNGYSSTLTSTTQGIVNISGITIYSYNGSGYDTNYKDRRSYVYFNGGTTYIYDSNFSYLGEAKDRNGGFEIENSPNSIISNNIFHNSAFGITSRTSDNVLISNNSIHDIVVNESAFANSGINIISSKNNTIRDNILYNIFNYNIPSGWEAVGIHTYNQANNLTIYNNTIYNSDIGLDAFWNTITFNISNNKIYNSSYDCLRIERTGINGIINNNLLYSCGTNTVKKGAGLHIFYFDGETNNQNISISNNIIYDNYRGISFYFGNNINLINNTIYNIKYGGDFLVGITNISNSSIINNTLSNFTGDGFRVISNNNVSFMNNLFSGVTKNLYFYNSLSSNILLSSIINPTNIYTGSISNTPSLNLSNSLIVYDNQTSIPVYGTNQEINLTLAPNQYVYVYTNTTTICDETNTTCYMNITGMNTLFNETADGSLNLTFTDNDINFLTKWYNWLVDGVSQLVGYGQNVFTYIFNLNANDNNATVVMSKSIANGSKICYQETATIATSCGGLATGSYNYSALLLGYEAVDGSYSTSTTCISGSCWLYINYTKPNNSLNAIWSKAPFVYSPSNVSISGDCWNYSNTTLILGVYLDSNIPTNMSFRCFNGTDFKELEFINGSLSAFGSHLKEESIYWNITTYTIPENTTFLVIENTTAPTITLNYPTALIDYGAINGTLQLNFTATDTNLDKVWYNYNGTNITIAGAVSGIANLSNITLTTKKNVTIYANDSAGNVKAEVFGWDYKVFENSRSFTTPIVETSLDTFVINVTSGLSLSSVYLNYNGTEYSTSLYGGVYTKQLPIPAVTQDSTMQVYWRFVYDGTNITSEITNQTVSKLIFNICNATINNTLINFTTKSATNPFPIVNSTFKSSWMLSASVGATPTNFTYEDIAGNKSSYAFCTNTNTTTIYTDAEVEYDGANYALNFYYLEDVNLTATNPQNISLYLLNDSLAAVTILKVVSASQQPQAEHQINIQSYDVGTGTFYLVGMAKTNFNGEDVAYLNWYDTLYKFIVLDENGNVVKTTGTTKISSSPTTIELENEITFPYDKFEDFVYSLYYENSTSNFVLTYTKPSGEVDKACLRVYKHGQGNDTLVCDECETSASATMFCNVASYGNGTYVALFYATGSFSLVDWIYEYVGGTFQTTIYNLLGNGDASFYAFLFAGLITVALFINAVFGIIALMIGLIGASALGFTALQWGQMTGVIIIGGFIIWILKR